MAGLNIVLSNISTETGNMTLDDLAAYDPYFSKLPASVAALVVLSAVAILLCIPTLVWHAKNRNVPAALMVAWIILADIFNVTNALLWPTDNVTTWYDGQGFCDVQIKLDLMGQMGLVGCLVCIMRALAEALNTDRTRLMPSASQRRRERFLTVLYCAALPLFMCVAHFVVQPNRYYIFALSGCVPSYSDAWLSVLLVHLWMPAVGLVAGWYAALVLVRLRRYRREFAAVLRSAASGMNRARFLRLFANALVFLVVYLPLQFFMLARNVGAAPITAWDWGVTHDPARWQTVVVVPAFGTVWPDRWVRASLGYAVFACFGLGADAKALYRQWFRALGFGVVFPSLEKGRGSSGGESGGRSAQGPSKGLRQRRAGNGSDVATESTMSLQLDKIKGKLPFFKAKGAHPSVTRGSTGSSEPSPTLPTNQKERAPETPTTPHTTSPLISSPPQSSSALGRLFGSIKHRFNISALFTKKSPGQHLQSQTEPSTVNTRVIELEQPKPTWKTANEAMQKAEEAKEYEEHIVRVLA